MTTNCNGDDVETGDVCITTLLSGKHNAIKKGFYDDMRLDMPFLASGCANLVYSQECLSGKRMIMTLKGRPRAPTVTPALQDCVTECGDRGRGKVACVIFRPAKCYQVDGLAEDIQCDFGELAEFIQGLSSDWAEFCEQIATRVAMAICEGMCVVGMPTGTIIPDGVPSSLSSLTRTEEDDAANTIPAFNLMDVRRTLGLLGKDRKKFNCMMVGPEIMTHIEMNQALYNAACCDGLNGSAEVSTFDGKKLMESEHMGWKEVCITEPYDSGPVTDIAFDSVAHNIYPILFSKQNALQMTDGSNPKKILQYEEDISCDNEKVVSRRIFCIGAENAYYTGGDEFSEFNGGTTDVMVDLCDLIDPLNWENGGYNKEECKRLLGPLDWDPKGKPDDWATNDPLGVWSNGQNRDNDAASAGVDDTAYKVQDLVRGTLNPLHSCENDNNKLPEEYALPYNCPFFIMWVSLDEDVIVTTKACP